MGRIDAAFLRGMEPAGLKAKSRKRVSVALDIADELAERDIGGRLSVIVECMPAGARLSAGTNNGDKTWSLTAEDLDGLELLVPEGMGGDHALTARVLRFDDDGYDVANTVALLDLHVHVPAEAGATDLSAESESDAEERLNAEKARWQVEAEQQLAAARAGWERDTAKQIAAAKTKWEADAAKRLEGAKAQWISAQREELTNAKAAWEAGTAKRLDRTKAEWSAAEREHLNAAKAKWESEAALRLASVKAQWSTTESQGLTAEKSKWQKLAERRLADEKAVWDKQASDRLTAAKTSWVQKTEQALATAEANWKAELEQTLAEAQARWHRDDEKRLASARSAWEGERAKAGDDPSPPAASAVKIADAVAAARIVWEAETEQRLAEADMQRRVDVEQRVADIQAAFENEARQRLKAAEERWREEEKARLSAAWDAWQADARNARPTGAENTSPPPTRAAKPPAEAAKPPAISIRLAPKPKPETTPASITPSTPAPASAPSQSPEDTAVPNKVSDAEWEIEMNARRAAADAKKEIEAAKKDTQERRKKAKIEVWSNMEAQHRRTTAMVKQRMGVPRLKRWRLALVVLCLLLGAAGALYLTRSETGLQAWLGRLAAVAAEPRHFL